MQEYNPKVLTSFSYEEEVRLAAMGLTPRRPVRDEKTLAMLKRAASGVPLTEGELAVIKMRIA